MPITTTGKGLCRFYVLIFAVFIPRRQVTQHGDFKWERTLYSWRLSKTILENGVEQSWLRFLTQRGNISLCTEIHQNRIKNGRDTAFQGIFNMAAAAILENGVGPSVFSFFASACQFSLCTEYQQIRIKNDRDSSFNDFPT
jgi:hypothetical protein